MTNTNTVSAPAFGSTGDDVVGNSSASMHLLFDASDTAGALSSLEVRLDPGVDGASPHFHRESSEMFYVVAGALHLMAGEEIVTVEAGGAVHIPRLMPHAFGALPDVAARVLIVLTPGVERFEYFRLLARIQAGEAPLAELAAAQGEYDNHFVDAPEWWRDRQSGQKA